MRRSLLWMPALAALFLLALPSDAFAKKRKSKAPSGANLFSENCAACHGNGGKGDGPNAKHVTPKPTDLTKLKADEKAIAGVVRDGKGACPAWRASLYEEEIAAVARFAGTLQR